MDMNLYARLGSVAGTAEAAALGVRLTAWHDAMVTHERRLRASTGDRCDDDCPHAEARQLWFEARAALGADAEELHFLRSRAVQWLDRETPSPA
jgi:hypothetical protein